MKFHGIENIYFFLILADPSSTLTSRNLEENQGMTFESLQPLIPPHATTSHFLSLSSGAQRGRRPSRPRCHFCDGMRYYTWYG